METITVILKTADNTWKQELFDLDIDTPIDVIRDGAQEKSGIPSTTPCDLALDRTNQILKNGTLSSSGVKSGDTLVLVPHPNFGYLTK